MFRTALLPFLLSLLLAPSALAASAGDPDTSFDGDGRQVLPVVLTGAPDLLLQPDGKLVVTGTAEENFGVWRLNPNGGLDAGFAADAIADFGGGSDYATSAALQPDGRILVAGGTKYGPGVARFTPTGALDPTFDPGGEEGAGKALVTGGSAEGVVVQADGRIAVIGSRSTGQQVDFVITRLKANGAPDEAKAPEVADFGGEDWVVEAAAAPGGKILAVGTSQTATEEVVAVARWNADGTLDKTFGQTGKKTLGAGKPATVAAQPDGKVLVVVRAENGDPTVVRLTNEGEIDRTFGVGGTTKRVFDGEKLARARGGPAGGDDRHAGVRRRRGDRGAAVRHGADLPARGRADAVLVLARIRQP
jgi:uncharacterized delta-60 repeat protein